mmetsp:Transcript_45788/g.73645  ORF Transcript_45788/g.73645 Transcript_45788/m.73645 type:complete len:207 (+) Transcript_45788:1024-1644(+)
MATQGRNARKTKVDHQALKIRHLLQVLTEGGGGSVANVAEALLLAARLAPAVAIAGADEDQFLIQIVVDEPRNHLETATIEMLQERGNATVTTGIRHLQHVEIETEIEIEIIVIVIIETIVTGMSTRRPGEATKGDATVTIETEIVALTRAVGMVAHLVGGKEVEQETLDEERKIAIVATELIGQIMIKVEEREAAQSLSKERKRL